MDEAEPIPPAVPDVSGNLPETSIPSSSPGPEFRSLDPGVVAYWRIHSLISSVVLIGLALVGGITVTFNFPGTFFGMAVAWGLLLLLRLGLLLWYPSRAYRAWSFRVDDKVLEIRHGVWFRTIVLLPLSRMQHVDLHQGPLERVLELASLTFHTAGTQNAAIDIAGLNAEEAAKLRDQLIAAGGDDAV